MMKVYRIFDQKTKTYYSKSGKHSIHDSYFSLKGAKLAIRQKVNRGASLDDLVLIEFELVLMGKIQANVLMED